MLPFILSCIRKPRFGSLDLSTYLGTCPSSCKLSLNLTMAATYAQVISKRELKELCSNFIETFHWALVGCTFRHEYPENGNNVASPIIPERNLGLKPSSTTPYFNKTSTNSRIKLLLGFLQAWGNKASKCNNGEPKGKEIAHLLVWSEQGH